MQLRYHLPRPDLRDYVRAYYLFETDEPTVQPLAAEIGNIRCLIQGGGRFLLSNGDWIFFAPALLTGSTMSALVVEAEAGTRCFGLGVLPRGWAALFGVDASELVDEMLALDAFVGPTARAFVEEVCNAADLPQMAAAADRFLSFLFARRASVRIRYPDAFEQWLLDPNDLDLDALIAMMDCSRRQTDRIAKRYFGACPKLLQRKYRALRAADRILLNGVRDWKEAAGPGFYDQSHFIKEFRTFIGASPGDCARGSMQLGLAIQAERRRILNRRNAALF